MLAKNSMELKFLSISSNESFARTAVGCFVAQLNPTLEELADIKTAVSEAVTNVIVHAYGDKTGDVNVSVALSPGEVSIRVSDTGRGIENIDKAMKPFYTTAKTEERSGMGFTIMQTFMDELKVTSGPNQGTTIAMRKKIQGKPANKAADDAK